MLFFYNYCIMSLLSYAQLQDGLFLVVFLRHDLASKVIGVGYNSCEFIGFVKMFQCNKHTLATDHYNLP